MDGLHLVANLYRCRGEKRFLVDAAPLRRFCLDAVAGAGLTPVGEMFHQFPGGGVTGAVVLAESHLAIHTWPEFGSVSLDVYVCNYTRDNTAKARGLLRGLIELFKPEEHIQHDVPRDQQYMYEWLNQDYGFVLRSSRRIECGRTEFQDLEVHDTPQFGKLLRLDGCFMTSERDEFHYHENLIHTAAMAHTAPKQILIIGGGDGGSSEEALKHPSVTRVVLVELDGKVVEVAKKHFGAVHRGAFDDPRLELHIEDGLNFIAGTREKFDLIALDLPDPVGPAAALYEEAFFRSCKRALAPGGALTLHMGSPVSRPGQVRAHFERLSNLFAIVRPYVVFIPLYGSLWSMACCSDTLDPLTLSEAEIERRITKRGITHLQYYNGATHHAVFALPNYVRELTVGSSPTPRLVPKRRAAGSS